MEKWFDRIDKVLAVAFVSLYVCAKVHFFTRYGKLGLGAYLEEHAWFWACMVIIALAGGFFTFLRRRIARPKQG